MKVNNKNFHRSDYKPIGKLVISQLSRWKLIDPGRKTVFLSFMIIAF
jgi:hypothetical protein